MPFGDLIVRGKADDGAVVVIVNVLVAVVVVALRITELAPKLQALSDGKPEHMGGERLIVPANPFVPVNVSTVEPEPPGLAIVIVAGFAEAVKVGGPFTVSARVAEEVA